MFKNWRKMSKSNKNMLKFVMLLKHCKTFQLIEKLLLRNLNSKSRGGFVALKSEINLKTDKKFKKT